MVVDFPQIPIARSGILKREKDTSVIKNCEKGYFYFRAKKKVTSVSKKTVLSRRFLNFSNFVFEKEKDTSVYQITVSLIGMYIQQNLICTYGGDI